MGYVIAALLVALVLWIIIDNRRLSVSRYTVCDRDFPNEFIGFRIVQLSDIHGARFGKENRRLISKIAAQNPDIILITGDLIDVRNPNIERAKELTIKLCEIAPVYFSSGNHEARFEGYKSLLEMLENCGVTVLENRAIEIERKGKTVMLCGITDPRFSTDYDYSNSLRVVKEELKTFEKYSEDYRILLSHRPELFEAYREARINLVFSGHAHGGQFRFPIVGGLFVPLEGFFPKYDSGIFIDSKTSMIVSRGIGRSIIPFRIGNPPDIVVAELTKAPL